MFGFVKSSKEKKVSTFVEKKKKKKKIMNSSKQCMNNTVCGIVKSLLLLPSCRCCSNVFTVVGAAAPTEVDPAPSVICNTRYY